MVGIKADPGRGAGDASLLLRDTGKGLFTQIQWFNRLRFGAVVGMAFATWTAARYVLVADVTPLLAIALFSLALNIGNVVWSRWNSNASVRSLRRHVDLQIGGDLLILTSLLHFSGGVTNPLVLSFVFHTFIAAFVLSLRAAIVVGCVSIGLIFGLAIAEHEGILAHYPLAIGLFDLSETNDLQLVMWVATLGLVLGLSIYFVSTIVRQIYKRDEALIGLSRQLALSEKLASIGTLAAGVSHEINNPVGVIRTKANVLRYRIADGDPKETLLTELDIIEKHTKRIATITEGLLAFSREAPFELRNLRVNPLVEEGADLVRVPYKAAEIGLDLRLDPIDPWISGSANHLLQVLVNVLLNAKDASRPGTRVAMSTSCDDEDVRIRIADQGEGIPEEVLGKIFDPFFTTKDVDRGTGLGLALSHGIVQRHGGRIEVESVVGAGATFTIVVPRHGRPVDSVA